MFGTRESVEQVEEGDELAPKFDENGLIPVVTTDINSGELLMMGYMNQEAFDMTKDKGLVTFYSRSKQRIWMKGETSNNTLKVDEIPTSDN